MKDTVVQKDTGKADIQEVQRHMACTEILYMPPEGIALIHGWIKWAFNMVANHLKVKK